MTTPLPEADRTDEQLDFLNRSHQEFSVGTVLRAHAANLVGRGISDTQISLPIVVNAECRDLAAETTKVAARASCFH